MRVVDGAFADDPFDIGRRQVRCLINDFDARGGRWLDGTERHSEDDPCGQRGKQQQLPLLPPISQTPPERGRQELHEGPTTHEHPALRRVHPHLLEVHPHQRKERTERRIEEKIEALHYDQLLVDGAEQHFQQIGFAPYLMRRILRLRISTTIN